MQLASAMDRAFEKTLDSQFLKQPLKPPFSKQIFSLAGATFFLRGWPSKPLLLSEISGLFRKPQVKGLARDVWEKVWRNIFRFLWRSRENQPVQ